MNEQLRHDLEAGGLEHDRPVNAVRGHQNVFADDVRVAGPEFLEIGQTRSVLSKVSGEGGVIHQRVEPDIGDVIPVEGEFDPPGQAGFRSGNAQVPRLLGHRIGQFVAAEGGKNKVRMLSQVTGQPRAVFGKPEIPILFLDKHDLAPLGSELALRVAFLVGQKLLLPHAVVSAVSGLVEVALIVQLLQHGLDRGDVARIGRLRPAVVGDAQLSPQRFEFFRDLTGELRGRNTGFFRRLLDFLPVLVDAGEEEHRTPALAVPARNHVGQHLFVSVTDMRWCVRVIDRGGDEKSLCRHQHPIKASRRPQPNVKKRESDVTSADAESGGPTPAAPSRAIGRREASLCPRADRFPSSDAARPPPAHPVLPARPHRRQSPHQARA